MSEDPTPTDSGRQFRQRTTPDLHLAALPGSWNWNENSVASAKCDELRHSCRDLLRRSGRRDR